MNLSKAERSRRHSRKLKLAALTALAGGGPIECACCGFDEVAFLSVDHVVPLNQPNASRRHHRYVYSDIAEGQVDLTQFRIACVDCNWGAHANRRSHTMMEMGQPAQYQGRVR